MPAVALLVALLIANSFLRRSKRIAPLSRAELLCIYLIVSASLPVAGFGMIRFLVLNLGNTFFFSTPENKWGEMQEHLPAWMVPNEPVRAFAGFYRGYSTPPWGDWLVPVVVWSVYIALLVGGGLCFTLLIRRRWIEEERLTFPIAARPLEMTQPGGGFFRSPLLWAGFLLPFIGQSLLALNALFPSVPAFQIKAKWYPVFNSLPWSAFGSVPIGFYPLSIGLAYLVPLDVSFSCWFFFLFTRLEAVFGAMAGYSQGATSSAAARFPYAEEQSAGAWLMLGLLTLWGARAHLRRSWRSPAGIGLIACAAGAVLFWVLAGMQLWAAVAILALYGLYLVAGMRIRAEAAGSGSSSARVESELAGGEHAWHGRLDAGHAGADADHARLHYRSSRPPNAVPSGDVEDGRARGSEAPPDDHRVPDRPRCCPARRVRHLANRVVPLWGGREGGELSPGEGEHRLQ